MEFRKGVIEMAFLTEDRAKLNRRLTREAISLAMQGKWREAVSVNQMILDNFPTDVEAYNRLGRALMELGEYARAREAYSKALELDPHNKIARKNLERLEMLGETSAPKHRDEHRIAPQLFLEETGKSGVVNLVNTASQEVLARMGAGDEVLLKIEGTKLLVTDRDGEYLGEVEPGHARRLIRLMEGGNKYAAAIAGLDGGVRVFIKETYQHPSQMGRLSFPVKEMAGFHPYLRGGLLRQEEQEEEEGEEDTFMDSLDTEE